jgi:hypothetical protein
MRTGLESLVWIRHRGRRVAIGELRGKVFAKEVRGSRHFLRQPPAIALDAKSLEAVQQAGATRVEITDVETGRVYTATFAQLEKFGFQIDRGFGKQIAMRFPRWKVKEARRD